MARESWCKPYDAWDETACLCQHHLEGGAALVCDDAACYQRTSQALMVGGYAQPASLSFAEPVRVSGRTAHKATVRHPRAAHRRARAA